VVAQTVGAVDEVIDWNPAFYDTFLSNYFQKRPLLIRKAVCGLPLTLDLLLSDYVELAGDEDVEARIFQTEKGKIKKYYGPFEPIDIENHMAKPGWSLLVQEMDRHVPQVADLWSSCFPFLPTWRRDDIMFSLSAPGGSIGAHVDNYDVFLLQGR
jgi:50S ribosomal protein L16 3-hydroxylase